MIAAVIRKKCPGIKVDGIEGCEIEQMNIFINDKSSEMVAFKGTLDALGNWLSLHSQ